MADYMISYMRRWRRTNAQLAVVIESSDDSDNEVSNQGGVNEDPMLNRVYWEIQMTRNLVMKMKKILILFPLIP